MRAGQLPGKGARSDPPPGRPAAVREAGPIDPELTQPYGDRLVRVPETIAGM